MMINQTRLLLIFHSSCPYTFIPFGQMTSFPPFFVHSLCHCVLFLLSLFAKKVDRYKKTWISLEILRIIIIFAAELPMLNLRGGEGVDDMLNALDNL